jgi:sterol desaturase/sphingolipid hydroxylase (fatty acid hydroxylase superfamily)
MGLGNTFDTVFHDYHHSENMGNYGTFILDWIFGTMDGFVERGLYDGYLWRKPKAY